MVEKDGHCENIITRPNHLAGKIVVDILLMQFQKISLNLFFLLKRCLIECLTAVDDEAWPLLLSISASLILVEPSRQDSSLSLQNWQNTLRVRMTSRILFCIFWFSLIYDNLIFAFSSRMVWQISSVVSFHSDLGICNRGRKTFLRKFLLSFSL